MLNKLLKFTKGREIALALLFFGFGIVVASKVLTKNEPQRSAAIPFLHSFSLQDSSNAKVNIDKLLSSEKPTLICLWATWCEPCVAELIELEKHKDRLKSKYEIVLVNVDGNDPSAIVPEVKNWLTTQKISLVTFFDFDDNFIRTLGIASIPHSLAISKDRKIIWQNSGILDLSIL